MYKMQPDYVRQALRAPKPYREHFFMDMCFEAEPVGHDPLTGEPIYWGWGCEIACLLEEDNPKNYDIPF